MDSERASTTGVSVQIWEDAPPYRPSGDPTLLYAAEPPISEATLWLAYGRVGGGAAVVRFQRVIDYRHAAINEHGLRKEHRYGDLLRSYDFHEVIGSPETQSWRLLGARHWVVSFHDTTLDVKAESVDVVADRVAQKPLQALLTTVRASLPSP